MCTICTRVAEPPSCPIASVASESSIANSYIRYSCNLQRSQHSYHRLACTTGVLKYVDAICKPHRADKVSKCVFVFDGPASCGSELTFGVCADSTPSARTARLRRMIGARCVWWRASVTPAGLRMCKTYTDCRSRPPSPGKVCAAMPMCLDYILSYDALAHSCSAAADDASQVASLSETLRSSARA